MLIGLALNIGLVVFEVTGRHSRHVAMAFAELTSGAQRPRFVTWMLGSVTGCCLVALDFGEVPSAIGALAALTGLFAYEDAYVRAGQSVPLS